HIRERGRSAVGSGGAGKKRGRVTVRSPAMYKDLRDFVERVDKLGELRRIEGADPRFEIGAITEVAAGRERGPALLFHGIRGFPRRYGIASTAGLSSARARSSSCATLTMVGPTLRSTGSRFMAPSV